MSVTTASATTVPVWRLAWRVSQHEPRSFWLGWGAFVVFFTLPAVNGYVLSQGFESLQQGDTAAVYRWALVLAVSEVVRMASIHFGAIMWTKSWVHMETFLRANLLTAQVASGGPQAGQPVGSAGEALTHFRDDTEDIAQLVDGMVDVSGGIVFTVAAGFILGAADPTGAAVLLLPLRRHRPRHPRPRLADQGVPSRRPGGDRRGHRSRRRPDGGGHDDQGLRLVRSDAGAVATARRPAPRHRGARSRPRRVGPGVQPRCRRRRSRSGVARQRGRHRVRCVRRRHAGVVRLVPRLAQLPAADGGARAGAAQAGRCGVRPDAPARRRPGRRQHGPARDLPLEQRQRGVRPSDDRPPRVPLERLDVHRARRRGTRAESACTT